MGLTDSVGKAAGNAAVDRVVNNPDILNKIISTAVTALVTALIDNLPKLIEGIQTAREKAK